jgi:cytochrome c553
MSIQKHCLIAAMMCVSVAAIAQSEFPSWAYPLTPLAPKPEPEEGVLQTVPGSSVSLTISQSRDRFSVPDWHPADHPAMPQIVSNGRKPDIWACGFCHRPNGAGGPENASLAGLPANYIEQQVRDLASGARSTALPKRVPHALKQPIAKGVSAEELKQAAAYFSSLKPQQMMIVKEGDLAPKLQQRTFFYAPTDDGAQEPIGNRIVEYPEDYRRFEVLRDARVKFVVHAPVGSVRKGEVLVRGPSGKAELACMSCHGADLRGAGDIPSIAGRSPSYIVRQLWDMQQGARNGSQAVLMKPALATLDSSDMLNIAAYLATLPP